MPQIVIAAALTLGPAALGYKLAVLAVQVAYSNNQRRRAERKAIAEYNRSLKDRLEMVEVSADAPRTLALGRVRAVESVRRRWVSGTNSEKLTMIVSFAGHRIDGFEKWYFNDTEVELDGNGWVVTEPYNKASRVSRSQSVTWPGGAPTITLAHVPIVGTISATWAGSEDAGSVAVASISGANVTFAEGGPPGQTVIISYQSTTLKSTARIRPYLGLATQNVGADLAAEYPGKLAATDRFAGIALAVIDFLYDTDVYPQGRPNVTALFRGARCYDPRKDSTAGGSGSHRANDEATWEWTDNSALCAYRYATWSSGFNLPAAELNTADVVAAANAADVSTVFTMRKPDGSTSTVTLPRYRCGIVISSAIDPRSGMAEILETMAGRSGWAGGVWRMRAGTVAAPSFSLTPDWLAQVLGADGKPTGAAPIAMSNGTTRDQKVNRVTGSCVDPDQRWQVLPFPAIKDATLIAEQGEYAAEVEFQGVNHIAHAQHLGSIAIRESQAALQIEARCNMHAYRCELFDVGALQLPRYGMTPELGKLAEVLGWRWHPTQGVVLQLAEIAEPVFTPLAELTGRDPAPNSGLPSTGLVDELTITGVTSGTEALTDGSVLTRTRVVWTPSTLEGVRNGGQIELQYTEATSPLPDGDWPSWMESGDASTATLPGLLTGQWYVFRVRGVKPVLGVRGLWSKQVAHQVALPPLASVKFLRIRTTGLAFAYAVGGAATPASITLTAELGGSLTGTATWSILAGSATLSGSGNTRTLAAADLASDSVTIVATLDGFSDTVTIVKVRDGATGAAGAQSALVYAYQRAASTPALPTVAATFTFATGAITGLNNGWQATPPAGSDPLYVTVATANSSGATDTIAAGEWASPVVLAQNGSNGAPGSDGTDGAPGLNVATVYLFQRTSSPTPPALPSATVYFVFTNGVAYEVNNGWTQNLPSIGGPYRWMTTATALGPNDTDALAPSEWAAASLLAQDGANGSNGINGADGVSTALVYIYQRSSSAPAVPSVTATFVFASASITGLNNGWSTAPPAGSLPLYVSVATASSSGASDTITSAEWAAPVVLAANGSDGANGTNGSNGLNVATVYLFQRTSSATPPALPSASVSFTFATGVAAGVDNGWTQSLPTTGGAYRWMTTATALSTGATDTLTSGEWAAASLLAQDGANGTNGTNGTNGSDGAPAISARLDRYVANFNADSTGLVDAGQSFAATITVLSGVADDTGSWTISRSSSDGSITTTQAGATITITGIGTGVDSGTVTVTATRSGYPTQNLVVQVGKVKRAVPSAYPSAFGAEVYSESYTSTPATAWLRLNSDGTAETSTNGSSWSPVGNWYTPTTAGIGSSYRVSNSQTGDAVSGGTDTLASLSGGRNFSLTASAGPSASQLKRGRLTLVIAANGSATPLAQGNVTLTAYHDRT